jgi:hypothetical protein
MAPDDADFAHAATWKLTLPPLPASLSDASLQIHYQGDVARLYQNTTLLDDNFWNGIPWTIGLRELPDTDGTPLELRILPLPKAYPMFLERSAELNFNSGPADKLNSVEIVPQYQLILTPASHE